MKLCKHMKKTIGIIGFGNMGSSIAEGIKEKYILVVFDKDKSKTADSVGIKVTVDIAGLAKEADVIILAVKPQDLDPVLEALKHVVKGKLVISIAAGITTTYIEKNLGDINVVRAMPNIAVKIGRAETSLCKGKSATDRDLEFARKLFEYLGKTWIMEEEKIDAATAIAGSGPAYIYFDMEKNNYNAKDLPELVKKDYIERLTKAAERVGFDLKTARELASATTASSIGLSAATNQSPAELRKQVASKGGTTEAALEVLSQDGSWEEAAVAAKKRAQELSKKE
ncbi:pyrroline-5-carboxylate reductase [bacterium]|nr:MAG: pyrroline-5-carboxylate reductase [bacterium]